MERVALFRGPGQAFDIGRFPAPTPRGGEMLVRVVCCALCGSDLHTHAGRRRVPTPTVLGHEVVGRIEAFGPNADRRDFRGAELAIGTRVSWSVAASCGRCFFCSNELPQKCASLFKYGHEKLDEAHPFAGGLADVVILRRGSSVIRVPDAVSNEIAASANCATATVAGLMRAAGDVAGRSMLIHGAGMLGLTACAMARSAGAAQIIVSDPDDTRRKQGANFGAMATADPEQLADCVANLTAGRGVDVAFELAGVADAVQAGLTLTRTGGTLILAGTVLPTPSIPLDPETVVRRCLTIRGVHNYVPCDLAAAIDFLGGPGRRYPFADLVAGQFRLDDIDQAFEFAHRNRGRVVVTP